ncbi:MAG: hypothetical protein RXR31_07290 [Thermoproteota archaeon]|jgi:Baculovirus U-box/Ring-like domain.
MRADDTNPSDFILIAEDIYIGFKEGGKAIATTPHESAWMRLGIIVCYLGVFQLLMKKLLQDENLKKEYDELLSKGQVFEINKFFITNCLKKFKYDEILDLYELRIKAEYKFPPEYNVTLEDLNKAIKIATNLISLLS